MYTVIIRMKYYCRMTESRDSMDMTYEHKTEHASPEKSVRAPERAALGGGIPNSAMLSMLRARPDDNHGRNTDALAATVMGRLPQMQGRPQAQLPQAEQEADRLSASVTSGSPDTVKATMGAKLEADLSGVRFHTDAASAARADAMGARAFTAGADVYFGGEGFDPAVAAHELVHTVQQGAVSGGTETVSAPLGGVQMWPWSRKRKDPGRGTIDFGQSLTDLKPGNLTGAKVSRIGTHGKDSGDVVLKMGTDPEMESAMSSFYTAAGNTYRKYDSRWNFDAPAYRPLGPEERPGALQALRNQQLSPEISGQLVPAPADANAPETPQEKQELDALGVYPAAQGHKPSKTDQRADRDDYRNMMGYVTMMDLVAGNNDRLSVLYNPENWLEDEQSQTVHLLDNDMYATGGGAGASKDAMQTSWLSTLVRQTSKNVDDPSGAHGNAQQAGANLFTNISNDPVTGNNAFKVIGDENAIFGLEQAVDDLPAMRKQLMKQFKKESGGRLTQPQEMLLERLQMAHDYMTNPQMADIYAELVAPVKGSNTVMGFSARQGEDPQITQHRNDLLGQLELLKGKKKHRSPLQWFKDLFSRKKG